MKASKEDKDLVLQLQNYGVIRKLECCSKCQSEVDLEYRQRNEEGNKLLTWRCRKGKCQAYHAVLSNSFFELNKKSFWTVIELIKFWCVQRSIIKAQELLILHDSKM